MKWNDKLYLSKQIANAIKHLHDNNIYFDPQYLQSLQTYKLDQSSDINNVGALLWEISSGTIPFESELPFDYDCLIAIIHGKRESDIAGVIMQIKSNYQYVVAHLNRIAIIEEFEEYAMEEDEIQLDQVDQRITTYKIDD
ncbi:hypothetical protein C2G38_2152090 [Gigaspora rosea]|uniref:Protein kinase domain-containing protein n=1 Tax=Gigaspora rosea TaxID=44941 RepID=A0A397W7F5_9GLOM|nr:hypothetical protein C2G38_2152090 [Gigaspora rosea]